MNRKFKRSKLTCEQLENRQLLASDLAGGFGFGDQDASPPGDSNDPLESIGTVQVSDDLAYTADGRDIPISFHPNRLAIATPSPEHFSYENLPGDLQLVRTIGNGLTVFESDVLTAAELQDALELFPGVGETTEVFVIKETNTEVALLNDIIAKLPEGVTPEQVMAENPEITGYERLLGTPDQFVFEFGDARGVETLSHASDLGESKLVSWVTPNFYQDWQRFYTPNDPRFGNQWHLENTGQGGGLADADPDLADAWDIVQGGSEDIVIGVYDDGVQRNHPDINNWVNEGEAAGDPFTDNDGNGWVHDLNGWNFVNNNNQSGPTNASDNHGTAVAGVAAAIGDNGIGVAGSSYGSPVIAGRLFDGSGVASTANIAAGIYYLAGRTADGTGQWDSADVVNNSWGGGGPSTALSDALTWATNDAKGGQGVPFLFASGNGFGDFLSYPAQYTTSIDGVISVGATNNFGERSNYSQHGPDLDIVAPSNDTRAGYLAIDTTDRTGSAGYNSSSDYTGTGGTGFGGTSSATPLATGITALLLARADTLGMTLSAADVKTLLRVNTDLNGPDRDFDTSTGKDFEMGFGRLNAALLVESLGKPEISVLNSTEDLESGASSTSFGEVILGQTASQTLRIRNQGSETLNISDISVDSSHFAVDTSGTETSLASGEATTFVLIASPTAGGTQSGTVTIVSNDADEGSFLLGVDADVAVPTVAGTIFEDGDVSGDHGTGESALSGLSVFLDANANDIFDVGSESFENTNETPIPDVNTVTSDIVVSGMAGNLFDVNVGLDITHTWDSDLIGTLIAPDGTRIELFNRIGGSGDNFTDTIFDDEAADPIASGSAPFTGTFRPNEPLSGYMGDPNGTWQLEISDNAGGDTGTLNRWSLEISTGESSFPVDEIGQFSLLNLPVGTHTVRVVPTPGDDWATVSPATGEYTYDVTGPNDSFVGQDFGLAHNDRFYATVFNDLDGDGVVDPNEAPLANWPIYIDVNDNGIFEPPVSHSFVNGTDVAITDNSTSTSEISAAGIDAAIADLDVRLEIEHTFAADLEVTLVAPDGTSVLMFADEGGGGDNFTGTIIDDEAEQSITTGSAPFTGRFRPENPLTAFDGLNGNGTWRLEVFDDAGGDVGTLLEWELMITEEGPQEPFFMTNEGGHAHHDLPEGTHSIRVAGRPDWEFTMPVDGKYSATPDGTPITANGFGVRPVNGVGGDIIVDTVWDNTDEPYRLVSDVRVRNGATLTIGEGVSVVVADPDFELHIGTSTETGILDAEDTTFSVGLVIQPDSSADLDGGSFNSGDVEVFGSLRASEVLFDANLMTKPGSNAAIRFANFAADNVFEFDSASVLNVFHSDFSAASENSVQAIGTPSDTINMVGNWWGTTDATAIGNIVLDRLDDDSRPLMDISDPLIVTPILGDANGDGNFTNADISGFLLALTNPAGYEGTYPDVDPDIVLDMDWSGGLTNADIAGFLSKLTGN